MNEMISMRHTLTGLRAQRYAIDQLIVKTEHDIDAYQATLCQPRVDPITVVESPSPQYTEWSPSPELPSRSLLFNRADQDLDIPSLSLPASLHRDVQPISGTQPPLSSIRSWPLDPTPPPPPSLALTSSSLELVLTPSPSLSLTQLSPCSTFPPSPLPVNATQQSHSPTWSISSAGQTTIPYTEAHPPPSILVSPSKVPEPTLYPILQPARKRRRFLANDATIPEPMDYNDIDQLSVSQVYGPYPSLDVDQVAKSTSVHDISNDTAFD
jgi:hypothetical protein